MPGIDTSMYTQSQPNAFLGTANEAAALRGQQIANQQAQTNLGMQRLQYVAGQFSTLANKPDLSPADFQNLGQSLLSEGADPATVQTEMANVQAAGNDPQKLRSLAQNFSQRALSGVDQLHSVYGAGDTIQSGSNTITGNRNLFTGAFAPASSFQQGMAPGDANSMVIVTNPDGSTQQVTKAQSVQMMNPNGNALTQQAPAQPQAPTNALTGSTFAPPGTGVPLAPQSPGIRAPSPQEQAMFKASADQYQTAKTNDSVYQAQLVPLEKSLALVGTTPLVGKGSQIPTDVAQVLNTFGINIGTNQADNAAELDKYLNQIALGGGLSGNSVQHLEATFGANPNIDTPRSAAQDVLKTMISLQRMQHAIVANAGAQNIAPQAYSDYARQQGSTLDPRAFGVDMMTPEAKAALLKEIQSSPAEKAKFVQSLRMAAQAGVLGDGGGQ